MTLSRYVLTIDGANLLGLAAHAGFSGPPNRRKQWWRWRLKTPPLPPQWGCRVFPSPEARMETAVLLWSLEHKWKWDPVFTAALCCCTLVCPPRIIAGHRWLWCVALTPVYVAGWLDWATWLTYIKLAIMIESRRFGGPIGSADWCDGWLCFKAAVLERTCYFVW